MKNWDVLRYILAIGRTGSISGAARQLGCNHATVSRQLAAAEAALGARLFDRHVSGLTPTAAGQATLARARVIETETLALDRDLTARDARLSGPITITVPQLLVTDDLAMDLRTFAQEHPDIALTVLGDNNLANLHRREADIAIRVSDNPGDSLWGRKVADQRVAYFGAPELVRELTERGSEAAVQVISFSMWQVPVPEELSQHVPNAFSAVQTDDMISALAMLRAGMGVTRLPMFLAEKGLKRLPFVPPKSYPPVWLLTHADLRNTARIATLLQFLASRFAARRSVFWGADG